MDPVRFDTLIKTLSTAGTRRRLLRLLAAVPVAGGLLALRETEGLAGNGRKDGKDGKDGKGRKGRGKSSKGKNRSRTSTRGLGGTTPPSDPCAGVSCGDCLTCVGGDCVADATQEGDACGTSGSCLSNGTCLTHCVFDGDFFVCPLAECGSCSIVLGGGGFVCASGIPDPDPCGSHAACPPGKFCPGQGLGCKVACTG